MRMISNAKDAWKWFSTQSLLAAGALQGAWVYVPDDLKVQAPENLISSLTWGILALGFVGRFVDQSHDY